MAAAEYEKVIGDNDDYLTSVSRFYNRSSVISNLTPIRLFVKVDPIYALDDKNKAVEKLREMTQMF